MKKVALTTLMLFAVMSALGQGITKRPGSGLLDQQARDSVTALRASIVLMVAADVKHEDSLAAQRTRIGWGLDSIALHATRIQRAIDSAAAVRTSANLALSGLTTARDSVRKAWDSVAVHRTNLGSIISASLTTRDSLRKAWDSLSTHKNRIQWTLDSIATHRTNFSQVISSLNASKDSLRKSWDSLASHNSRLTKTMDSVTAHRTNLTSLFSGLTTSRDSLRKAWDSVATHRSNLSSIITAQNTSRDSVRKAWDSIAVHRTNITSLNAKFSFPSDSLRKSWDTLAVHRTNLTTLFTRADNASDSLKDAYLSGFMGVADSVFLEDGYAFITANTTQKDTLIDLYYGSPAINTYHNFDGTIIMAERNISAALDSAIYGTASMASIDSMRERLDTLGLTDLNDFNLEELRDWQEIRYDSVNGAWINTDETLMKKDVSNAGLAEVSKMGVPVYYPTTANWMPAELPYLSIPDTIPRKPLVGGRDTVVYVSMPDTGRWIMVWSAGAMTYMRDTVVMVWNLTAETTDTVATQTALYKFQLPVAMYVTHAYAAVRDKDNVDSTKFDVNRRVGSTDTTSLFGTYKIVIQGNTYSSRDNPSQPTPAAVLLTEGTWLTVDVDKGSGAIGAKLTLKGWKP